MRIGRQVEAVIQDVRFGIRLLLREPAFTATVLITLALSIGSTTAVFTLVDVLLLRPLPVRSPERLFSIAAPGRNVDLNPSYYSHGFYEHLRTSGPLFRDLLASSTPVSSGVHLTDGAVTDRVRCELVSGNYFDVLGVGAAAGRILTSGDDRTPGAHPVLVLSDAFWQRRFAGAPDVVGRTVSLNGAPFTVVGVATRGFFGTKPGFGADIWAPLMMAQPITAGSIAPLGRNQNYLEMIVRLEPEVDVRRAQALATTVYANWLGEDASSQSKGAVPTLHLTPAGAGHSLLRAQYGQPLLLLTAAVLLLLLIACANIATLLMSRATARAGEIAVRTAIGATRQRLVRQLMTESVFIAAIGGAFGWVVCVYFGRIMLTFLPATAEAWQFSPDRRIFASTFLVAFGSGLLFGLAPVIQVARRQVANLRSRTGTAHTARRMLDSRELLTVVQIALTIVLVTGAGLFARTLQNLRAADMGFDRDHVLLASIDPARSGYTRPRTAVFFDHLLQRLRSRGDIDAVGLASHGTLSGVLPAGTRFMSTQMHADGVTVPSTADLTVHHNVVSPGYFEASGVSLLRGRHFTELDRAENVQVAVLNQAAAHMFFGNGDPIGRRVGPGRQGPAAIEVVGVVENAKYLSVREAPIPTVYLPFRDGSPMTLHVKTRADPRSALRAIEQELQALDPTLPLFQVQTIEARVDDALRQERLVATLATILSVSAILIAAVGIYGLISFSVAQRTREIGIRIAVGAEPRQILLMVLGRAFVLVALGIGVGLPMAMGSLRVAGSFLYGVTPGHPAILAGVLTVVTVVALAAALVPAGAAARTDPWNALRRD
jgi:putative ABC transport system permease protein